MPSREDYQGGILKEDGNDRTTGLDGAAGVDIDAVTEMSEEEIERLLSAGAESGGRQETKELEEEAFPGDVVEMLEDADDDDLWDIQDMLKKSDRNEALEDAGADSFEGEESPADRLLADIEAPPEEEASDSKTRKAMEKKRRKAEKAAEKKAAKEAAKAAKEARRAQKKSAKKEKIVLAEDSGEKDSGAIEEFDLVLDKDLLDSIVSEAGNLGEKAPEDPGRGAMSGIQEEAIDLLGNGLDLEEPQAEAGAERKEKASIPDSGIMELDLDEVDAFIPDVDAGPKGGEEAKEKKGFMSKIITLLTEEEPENEDIKLSDENQGILDELDGEKGAKKKGKKPAKKKAAKKPKKAEKKKEPKPAKPKKPKKEKKPREAEPSIPGRKLTFKKMFPILLLGATLGVVVFLFVNLSAAYSLNQAATAAFEAGDYETCYLKLYGQEMNEEQARMYGKSESILYLRLMYREYEMLLADGSEALALDSLLQTIHNYPTVYAYAAECGAEPEVGEIYAQMLNTLAEKYGITEAEALAIADIKSDIKYTRAVTALVEGKGYGGDMPSDEPGTAPEEEPSADEEGTLQDLLPEEAEMEEGNFVD